MQKLSKIDSEVKAKGGRKAATQGPAAALIDTIANCLFKNLNDDDYEQCMD